MKVTLDKKKCMNSGMCTQAAPKIFEMDDEGELVILIEDVTDEHLGDVKDAVACCPTNALQLK